MKSDPGHDRRAHPPRPCPEHGRQRDRAAAGDLYCRAVDRDLVAVTPTERLALPKERARPQRVCEPRQVDALLRALPDQQKVLWSAAVHTGLRLGELQALGWASVDLDGGVLAVERSWDRVAGFEVEVG